MIETVKRVVCDRCGKAGPVAMESEDPGTVAREAGWQVQTDILSDEEDWCDVFDYCPGCLFMMKEVAVAKAERDRGA